MVEYLSWQVLRNILPGISIVEMWMMDFVNYLEKYLIQPLIFLVFLVSNMIKAWKGTRRKQQQMLNYIKQ